MELAQRYRARALAGALSAAAALAGCSPVYLYQSAAGHMGLLARRQSIEKVLADENAPAALKEKLRVVEQARAFAFETLGLKRSRDYSTYSEVKGPVLTYLVTAAPPLRLEPYIWHFGLFGSYPYKGFFNKRDAEAEAAHMRRLGFDVCITGASAYNTPLWFSDPVPSTALAFSTGALAALILHELTHGTLFFKRDVAFSEALATFVGERGAQEFLARRLGADARALADYRRELESDRRLAERFAALRAELEALYGGPESDQEKLRRREPVFARARPELEALGWRSPTLNNATLAALRVYRSSERELAAALARAGGDWRAFLRALRGLDKSRPAEDLRRLSAIGRRGSRE